MIKKISHIGLAVDNLAQARAFFDETFDLSVSAQEQFGELLFSFISIGETDLELLQSTTPEGQIAKFINKRGQGSITTTGLTLFEPDRLQNSVHLWRSTVGWLGGFFVWVTAIAILAPLNLGGFEVSSTAEVGQGASIGTTQKETTLQGQNEYTSTME